MTLLNFMAWRYEIRGAGNRLVQMRTGFATEKASTTSWRAWQEKAYAVCCLLERTGTLNGGSLERYCREAKGGDWLNKLLYGSSETVTKRMTNERFVVMTVE
jgi:hypothetical protein